MKPTYRKVYKFIGSIETGRVRKVSRENSSSNPLGDRFSPAQKSRIDNAVRFTQEMQRKSDTAIRSYDE